MALLRLVSHVFSLSLADAVHPEGTLWILPRLDPSRLPCPFPTQGSNPGLPHCRRILYHLSHWGSPDVLNINIFFHFCGLSSHSLDIVFNRAEVLILMKFCLLIISFASCVLMLHQKGHNQGHLDFLPCYFRGLFQFFLYFTFTSMIHFEFCFYVCVKDVIWF